MVGPANIHEDVTLGRRGTTCTGTLNREQLRADNGGSEAEANQLRAKKLRDDGTQLIKENRISDGAKLYAEAVSIYEKFQTLDPDGSVRANVWNALCWDATVRGHAPEVTVMEACEQAVKLSEHGFVSGNCRDSRGLARALTGNTDGAVEDFQFYIDHATDSQLKSQRREWIRALRAGEKPFTAALLASLANQ
jgi:hypothetical protein